MTTDSRIPETTPSGQTPERKSFIGIHRGKTPAGVPVSEQPPEKERPTTLRPRAYSAPVTSKELKEAQASVLTVGAQDLAGKSLEELQQMLQAAEVELATCGKGLPGKLKLKVADNVKQTIQRIQAEIVSVLAETCCSRTADKSTIEEFFTALSSISPPIDEQIQKRLLRNLNDVCTFANVTKEEGKALFQRGLEKLWPTFDSATLRSLKEDATIPTEVRDVIAECEKDFSTIEQLFDPNNTTVTVKNLSNEGLRRFSEVVIGEARKQGNAKVLQQVFTDCKHEMESEGRTGFDFELAQINKELTARKAEAQKRPAEPEVTKEEKPDRPRSVTEHSLTQAESDRYALALGMFDITRNLVGKNQKIAKMGTEFGSVDRKSKPIAYLARMLGIETGASQDAGTTAAKFLAEVGRLQSEVAGKTDPTSIGIQDMLRKMVLNLSTSEWFQQVLHHHPEVIGTFVSMLHQIGQNVTEKENNYLLQDILDSKIGKEVPELQGEIEKLRAQQDAVILLEIREGNYTKAYALSDDGLKNLYQLSEGDQVLPKTKATIRMWHKRAAAAHFFRSAVEDPTKRSTVAGGIPALFSEGRKIDMTAAIDELNLMAQEYRTSSDVEARDSFVKFLGEFRDVNQAWIDDPTTTPPECKDMWQEILKTMKVPQAQTEVQIPPVQPKLHCSSILTAAGMGQLRDYDNAVETMAGGLFESSKALFLELDPSVFARGNTDNPDPPSTQLEKSRADTKTVTTFSHWLQDQVCDSKTPEEAIQKCRFLADVAEKCFEMGDLESYVMISSALLSGSVARMINHDEGMKIDERIRGSKKPLLEITKKMSTFSEHSYKLLRDQYAHQDKEGTACIPFLGQELTDMTFGVDGNVGANAVNRVRLIGEMTATNRARQARLRAATAGRPRGAGFGEFEEMKATAKQEVQKEKKLLTEDARKNKKKADAAEETKMDDGRYIKSTALFPRRK